jgi:tetratricopeptide (TPR) repeat protein
LTLVKGREIEWINRLQTEFDNIRTAVEWGLSNDPFATARMIFALAFLMVMTSYSGEAHRWGELTLKTIDDLGRELSDEEQLHRARLLVSMMVMSFAMGDNETSRKEGWEAYPVLKNSSDDKRIFALSLGFLCGASVITGHKEEAVKVFEEARARAEELGDKYIIGTVLSAGSRVEVFAKGDFTKAIKYQTKASELLREHGNYWSYGISMFGFGNLYLAHKEFEKSREKYKIAMQAMQKLGSNRNVVMIKSDLAHILRYEGKHTEALAAYRETIKDWQRMGHRAAIAHQLESVAFINKAMEETDKAVQLLGAAERLREIIEINMTPQEHDEYEKEAADLKANMDEKDFKSLWAEGRSMSMDEAIELALSK